MPGRGSYGPGGKWIYERAKKLRAKNPDMEESTSFAIATQQAHKVNKSPKGFRTPQGVRTAKAKMSKPIKEYRKTAMLRGLFDELEHIEKIALTPGLLRRAAEKSMQRAGGKLTPQAQRLHQAVWRKQQTARKALAPRMKAYQAAQGRVAKKAPKPGIFSRIFGGARQPALAGA